MNAWLSVENLKIGYDGQTVIKNCSFAIAKGEILSLLGASGCGKSTILKAIAGLLPIEGGQIILNEKLIAGSGVHVVPQERHIGMIFQDYALFPHLTVAQNIAFGLRHLDRKSQNDKIAAMLSMVRLENLGQRYPHELSGGQQQRVSIARALAREPHLLLLDEPFSNLDNEVRQQLMLEMKQLFAAENMSAIFVTHNKAEAFTLADKVAVMKGGEIAQLDSPKALYDRPASEEIATFLGQGTVLEMKKSAGTWQSSAGDIPPTAQKDFICHFEDENRAFVFLRPHQLQMLPTDEDANASVAGIDFHGDFSIYTVLLGKQRVKVVCTYRFEKGEKVSLKICL